MILSEPPLAVMEIHRNAGAGTCSVPTHLIFAPTASICFIKDHGADIIEHGQGSFTDSNRVEGDGPKTVKREALIGFQLNRGLCPCGQRRHGTGNR